MESEIRAGSEDADDEIVQMVAELTFQKEYLKARFIELNDNRIGIGIGQGMGEQTGDSTSEDLPRLREEMRSLSVEIQERRETQKAAEDALANLRVLYSELDARAEDLAAQLVEGWLFLPLYFSFVLGTMLSSVIRNNSLELA